jgi:hypothetical protein
VGGGGNKLRGTYAPSPGGGTGVKNGLAAPFGPPSTPIATPIGGGVGVPAGIGTTGIAGDGEDAMREDGGGPSGVREGGGGNALLKACRANGAGAPVCPTGIEGGGGSVDAGVAWAGAQCVVDGGGTEVPAVLSGSAEMGGADVLTDGGGGGMGEKGDEGGPGGADRDCAVGGGGTERDCAVGGGGTERP